MSEFRRANQQQSNKKQTRVKAATNPALALAVKNNSQSKKKRTRRRPRNNRPKYTGTNESVKQMMNSVHPCVAQYASALADPEGTPSGACVPFGFPVSSQRIKCLVRGTMALGTTGQGFVFVNQVIANDATAVVNTAATSVGTAATAMNAFTNLVNTNMVKLPYTTALLNATSSGRVVAMCLKIRYTGLESGRNGTVTTFECPSATAVRPDNLNGNAIVQSTNSLKERPSPLGTWHVVNYTGPVTSTQASFAGATTWAGFGGQLVAFVDGVAGDKYEWEVYAHYEFSGTDIPGTAMTHSDTGMFSKVIESLKAVTVSSPLNDQNNKSAFSSFFSDAGSSVWNYVKKNGMSIALDTLSSTFLPQTKALKMLTM